MRTETCRQERAAGDVKIESKPESGEVQLGQRWRDSSTNKVQSVKERGFSAEAVNPRVQTADEYLFSK